VSEEWGPWIDHDGRGCPCVGEVVMAEKTITGIEGPFIAGADSMKRFGRTDVPQSAWFRAKHPEYLGNKIIRYRIRKPKGLTILEGILDNLPKEMECLK